MATSGIDVRLYCSPGGSCPFTDWISDLDPVVRHRLRERINRVRLGHLGDCKGVGMGVFELRISFGPGYRIYFGKFRNSLIILLGGGDKDTQARDIEKAQDRWMDYRRRTYAH